MEVLAALAIFLISMIALGQLLTVSGERAFEVQQQSHAAQLCQSKLAEVVSGVVPLSSTSESYDEDSDWQWTLDAEQDSAITGLWRVQVKAFRDFPDGSHYESSVSQMVLDPSLRGSTADALQSPIVGSNPSSGTGPSPTNPQTANPQTTAPKATGPGPMPTKATSPTTTTPRPTTPTTIPTGGASSSTKGSSTPSTGTAKKGG
jgi:hypothetical protein